LDDARLDYEVLAHSASGSTYSVKHGSIGTYQPGNKLANRDKWTYRNNEPNNVWDMFYNEVVNIDYDTDDGRVMRILITGVDTGYYTHFAYHFIDTYPEQIVGLKGDQTDKYRKVNRDAPIYRKSRERRRLYILDVEIIKDIIAERMGLNRVDPQPPGFMNYPQPSNGLYTVPGYFSQYEAEEKRLEQNEDGDVVGWKWIRKHASNANHFWDVAVYNQALRDIISRLICEEMGVKGGGFNEFVDIVSQVSE
jgi:phage terminase large subunit GpA-like protein